MICHLRTTAIGFGLLASLACQHASQNQLDGDGSGGPASSETAAIIDGQTVTIGELDDFVREQLFNEATSERNPANLYEVRSRALTGMIDKLALENAASAADLAPDQYIEHQIEVRGDVSEEEISLFYDDNIDRMGGKDLEAMTDPIRAYLTEQRVGAILIELREQTDAEILLEPARVEVEAIGPFKGPDDAVVTIIEFSDFQCPYCQRVVPTIDQIVAKYPTQVRFVFRNLPLDRIHSRARAAAEAAACADKQGDFWGYHDLIFATPKALTDEDLERYATELGLESAAFSQCVQNRETRSIVDADVAAAESLQISGTPSFLVNGIPMHGAQGLENFSEIIDAEIARNSNDGSKATR